jgi:hypothetical protein
VDNVRKADPRLEKRVAEIEISGHHYLIDAHFTQRNVNEGGPRGQTYVRDDVTGFESMQAHANRHNGIGSSTYTEAAREPITGRETGAKPKSPEETMAHELQHMHDISKGVSPKMPPGTFIGKKPLLPTRLLDDEENENRAVRTENIYNHARQIPLRTKYNGRRVLNPGPEHSPLNDLMPKPSSPQPPAPPP